MNKQDKQKLIDTDKSMVVTRGKEFGELVKAVKYIVMEEDLTLDGEHTMQCTNDVSLNCKLETCIILLTNVISKI